MSRNNIIEEVNKEDILNNISLEDVVSRYVHLKPSSGRLIGLCPNHKEKSPSFILDVNKGIYKCFGCGFGGNNMFSFVMSIENCTYKEALIKINENHKHNIIKKSNIFRKSILKEDIEIKFVDGNWTDKHLEYWSFLEEDYKWLESKNIFAVKEWAMGTKSKMKKIAPTKNEITFAYHAPDINKCKILRIGPYIDKKDKWRNTAPNTYLWYKHEIKEECKDLFIVKSVKDTVLLHKLGRCAISLNNEDVNIFFQNEAENINKLAQRKILLLGSDDQGWNMSYLGTCHAKDAEWNNWTYFNIENHLYYQFGIEDPTDYIKEGGFTLKQLNNKLKEKGF